MSYNDQTRLLVAKREDEDEPMIIGAMPMTTWEIIPPEDWDKWKRRQGAESFGEDWTAYDYIEIVITIPTAKLKALFDAREFSFVEAKPETKLPDRLAMAERNAHTYENGWGSPSKPPSESTNPFPPVVPCDGGRMAENGPQTLQEDTTPWKGTGLIHMGPGPHIGTDDGGEYC